MFIERTNREPCIQPDPSSWWKGLFLEAVGKKINLFCVASTVLGLYWLVQEIHCSSIGLVREWLEDWGCPVLPGSNNI